MLGFFCGGRKVELLLPRFCTLLGLFLRDINGNRSEEEVPPFPRGKQHRLFLPFRLIRLILPGGGGGGARCRRPSLPVFSSAPKTETDDAPKPVQPPPQRERTEETKRRRQLRRKCRGKRREVSPLTHFPISFSPSLGGTQEHHLYG